MIENSNKNKLKGLAAGLFIGLMTTFIGTYLFVTIIMESEFVFGLEIVKKQGDLGKVITLGAVLNLIVFFTLLKFNKEMMARGVILGTILLAFLTFFV
jgi:hypothetical protein